MSNCYLTFTLEIRFNNFRNYYEFVVHVKINFHLGFLFNRSGKISKEDLKNVLNKLAINMDAGTFDKLFET